MNFLLWYFTLSHVMWDLLESVCKLQDMYYTCKAYPCIPFWVLETPEILHNHHWKSSASSCENNSERALHKNVLFVSCKLLQNKIHLIEVLHFVCIDLWNKRICVEIELDMLYKCNKCLEAYKHFLISLTWHRKA